MSNINFFKKNKLNSTVTPTFTSANTALMVNLYDNDTTSKLISSGSNDATPEVWQFDFAASVMIDAIHIANHNIKSGKIEYYNGANYVDFSTPIAWTANAAADNYFSFTQISTTSIKLTMNTTIVTNAQKSVGELRFLELLGTLSNNPSKFDIKFIEKTKEQVLDNGASLSVFFGENAEIKLKLDQCTQADMDILRTIKNTRASFYVYPNGGSNLTALQEGLRVRDMYFVNWTSDYTYKLPSGHLTGTIVGTDLTLKEAV